MSREAHFSFVAIEYKQFLVDAGYMVTESENFPRLCLAAMKFCRPTCLVFIEAVKCTTVNW